MKKMISGWGNYPTAEAELKRPERIRQIEEAVEKGGIARGLGRSYGDAAIDSEKGVVLMERMNRFLDFDAENGLLRAEAGCTLEEIIDTFLPRGWFLPVTPGTKFTTLGGCFAADIHGKNHHLDGTFCQHVQEIELLLANGTKKRCSQEKNSELYRATAGGMGLTGIITEMTLQLIPVESGYIRAVHTPAPNLDIAVKLLESAEEKYSVAWIDCLATGDSFGRSVIMNGKHARKSEVEREPLFPKKRKQWPLPPLFPSWALNSYSIRAFNALYYKTQGKKTAPFIVDYDRFFYPLDAIKGWNRMYGKKGFLQYQFVVPKEEAHLSLRIILGELAKSGRGSFLAVLKRFGPENANFLSFPREGYTLALDMPVSDKELFPFLNFLDDLVLRYGGRSYLAKDARLGPETFRKMYPRFPDWQKVKAAADPEGRFSSDLSRRLRMGGPS